ncbi:surfeit locus protein 6 homolog [Homarus americanus]|uniref:surfeit locus protein 6 homolog n=1 Tax=Homarus americanus TaxID=6706 RepID=UPI001C476C6A|nr:surfeit locus protein 6 homolog [Homarus americanus]XP_042205380.1 surfeit locus protein 6 homolog [Homarus americanus]
MTEDVVCTSSSSTSMVDVRKSKKKRRHLNDMTISDVIIENSDTKVENGDDSTFMVKKKQKKRKHKSLEMDVEENEGVSEYLVPSEPHKKKKKKKDKKIVEEREKGNQPKLNGGSEDVAESIDSGCIADMTDWPQVKDALVEENRFLSNYIRLVPVRPVIAPEEEDQGDEKHQQEKNSSNVAPFRRDGGYMAGLQNLQEKYLSKLALLRQSRKKGRDPVRKKKEAKLNKKIARLDKRVKKKTKPHPINQEHEIKTEKGIAQGGNRATPTIYNQKGELVFSKFDFSSSSTAAEVDSNLKPRDLKQVLSQALKEKEKVKRMEQKGYLGSAAEVLDQKAWSGALQKAEGIKIKNDVDLLKKSLHKKSARKKASQKSWEERKEAINRKILEKQNNRQKNVKSRKNAKLSKKMKKMKNKGHIVPGF